MGSLIKKFSVMGIISQVIWAMLIFSSFSVERVLTDFGQIGPYFIGLLSLTSTIGWLLMLTHLLGSGEIDNKKMWAIALFFLPGQFIFWIKFIQNSEELDEMNEKAFDRDAFLQQYELDLPKAKAPQVHQIQEESAVFVPAFSTTRKRGLTPPQFMSIHVPKSKQGPTSGYKRMT